MMKRILALLTALAMLLGCAAAETAPEEGPQIHQIEMKTVPVYNYPAGISSVGFPLYFADGADDLAYVDLTDWGPTCMASASPTSTSCSQTSPAVLALALT